MICLVLTPIHELFPDFYIFRCAICLTTTVHREAFNFPLPLHELLFCVDRLPLLSSLFKVCKIPQEAEWSTFLFKKVDFQWQPLQLFQLWVAGLQSHCLGKSTGNRGGEKPQSVSSIEISSTGTFSTWGTKMCQKSPSFLFLSFDKAQRFSRKGEEKQLLFFFSFFFFYQWCF